MSKNFKWLVKDGRVLLLHRVTGLFGAQWECFGNFDCGGGNTLRGKQIIRLLNECDTNSEQSDQQ